MLKTCVLFLFLLTISVSSRAELPSLGIHALGSSYKSGPWSSGVSFENRIAASRFLRLRGGSDEEGKEAKADSEGSAEAADGAEGEEAVGKDEEEGPMDLNKALKQVQVTARRNIDHCCQDSHSRAIPTYACHQ
jgi:hypothetical protein